MCTEIVGLKKLRIFCQINYITSVKKFNNIFCNSTKYVNVNTEKALILALLQEAWDETLNTVPPKESVNEEVKFYTGSFLQHENKKVCYCVNLLSSLPNIIISTHSFSCQINPILQVTYATLAFTHRQMFPLEKKIKYNKHSGLYQRRIHF